MTKPVLVHLAADYPDPSRPWKTQAVKRLLLGTPDLDHVVLSLERVSNPAREETLDLGHDGPLRLFHLRYFAPPLGIALAPMMRRLADRAAALLDQHGIQPDVIHAHKYCFEGIAGLHLTRHFKESRLFVSIRGEAETKAMTMKPHYLGLFRRIAARADQIYAVSAWYKPVMARRIPGLAEKCRNLPNIVGNARPDIPIKPPVAGFVSIMGLDMHRRKGLKHLLKAFARFRSTHPEVQLDIIGGGSEASVLAATKIIGGMNLTGSVYLKGKMANRDLLAALPDYQAMVLPSFNETFGMAYTEALFAGIPILYGRNTGIDGYLDNLNVGLSATPGHVAEIKTALERLHEDNASFRDAIHDNQKVLYARFNPQAVLDSYRQDVMSGIVTSAAGG